MESQDSWVSRALPPENNNAGPVSLLTLLGPAICVNSEDPFTDPLIARSRYFANSNSVSWQPIRDVHFPGVHENRSVFVDKQHDPVSRNRK